MVNPVGFRFRPTEIEIIDHYLTPKNLGGTSSHLDEVMNTVNICSFDPWDLPPQSRIKTKDQIWYFFSRKENKGARQIRKTNSGFWKKTGVTMDIMRKKGASREKIGEKRVLVFQSSKILGGSKSDWVMHEYYSTCSSPNQMMMTYTICKVQFKGEATDISSSDCEVKHSHGRLTSRPEGSSVELLCSQELRNPSLLSGFLDEQQQETQLEEAIHRAFDSLSSYDWKSLLDICHNS